MRTRWRRRFRPNFHCDKVLARVGNRVHPGGPFCGRPKRREPAPIARSRAPPTPACILRAGKPQGVFQDTDDLPILQIACRNDDLEVSKEMPLPHGLAISGVRSRWNLMFNLSNALLHVQYIESDVLYKRPGARHAPPSDATPWVPCF